MSTATLLPYLPPLGADGFASEADPEDLLEAFAHWAEEGGRPLYPHQEEALLEVMTGSHVVLATPTGSGKSMVALGAHFLALATWRAGARGRTFYTAPLKALVSEKFFDLVDTFGAENVGMMTGDSQVNQGAPIICCTAEILANMALRNGDDGTVGQVVMDEFHYYGDPQRGWAWQVPLLEIPNAQFILMSATLGDTTKLREDLEERSGRPVAEVTSAERPVPLEFEYSVDPMVDVLTGLVKDQRAPVYVVHFTQKDTVERAQSLMSLNVCTRAEKDAIAEEIGAFRFGTGFGRTLSRYVRAGIGVHHAGMLPKYRRLVERLTQRGLLKVVCGTDTLGVGINVPIRTVLFTGLVKYDGVKSRHLTAREFHQIAGRAGRAGFDTLGEVVVQAPEHVIENRSALIRAGDDPKKLKKIKRKSAPQGFVNWTDATFERLRDAEPEALVSQFRVTHSLVLNVLSRDDGPDPVDTMRHLLLVNHDSERERSAHIRQAFRIYRSLRSSGVIEKVRIPSDDEPSGFRPSVRLMMDIPEDFALNQPLAPFAFAAMDLVNLDSPTHALDVVSVIEATLDDPRAILVAQQKAARGAAIAEMKADGLDYHDRMNLLDDYTWPRPLAEVLEPAFTVYCRTNPWIADEEISPKAVVRDMVEKAMTFTDLVSTYGLERSEGVALRYLADAYRALRQTVPEEHRTEEVLEIVEWLGEVVRGVDSSLLDEWERIQAGMDAGDAAIALRGAGDGTGAGDGAGGGDGASTGLTSNPRALRRFVRNALFRLVELCARERYDDLAALGILVESENLSPWNADAWQDALDPLFVEQGDDAIGTDTAARSASLLTIAEPGASLPDGAALPTNWPSDEVPPGTWWVRQIFDDLDGHHDWAITATVDLAATDASGEVALTLLSVGPLG